VNSLRDVPMSAVVDLAAAQVPSYVRASGPKLPSARL